MNQVAYCMKCEKQIEVQGATIVKMANGMRRLSGVCPQCGSAVSKILGK